MALAVVVHAALAIVMLSVAAAAGKPTAAPNSSAGAKTIPPSPGSNALRAPGTSDGLPAPVAEMREAILAAVQSGAIADLALPLSWNEMKPDVTDKASDDPIEHWKKTSGDGAGREILAVLGRILEMRPARVHHGADVENNAVYVWPYLAEADLAALKPAEEVDLYRLMTPAEAKAMREKKKWTWWRLAIGADGTWHTFRRMD